MAKFLLTAWCLLLLIVVGIMAMPRVEGYLWAPSCKNRDVMAEVADQLKDEGDLSSIFFNNIHEISGGLFSGVRNCSAMAGATLTNIPLDHQEGKSVFYTITQNKLRGDTTVKARWGSFSG